MSKEIVEAVHVLEREKGISAERLMLALEDALLSAYKKTARRGPVRARRHGSRHRRLQGVRAADPAGDRGAGARRGGDRGADWSTPRPASCASRADPELDLEMLAEYRDQIERARRHARRLRPHRRADRQAGDPPADPRGRAGHDVRRVPRPRRRADHRHRPAVRLALHARAAARARRGAAAQVRAGRQRALRPRRSASRPSSPTSRTRPRARASSSRAARPS